ncbi:DNA-binding response regulator [Paenibacillus sp. VTT E-133280]|jgi:DNA-binding response OmpR family regulator|uniref:response regulator transcription factor n=1 Tax=unclassified Paenibacillus TaxID=185978 RepID=UPI000BA13953|nr:MULTISPECIES: response regulator transcription factor [unclassified Paenibacillus]OZQ63324.1 DNA-binding response regulator [Paenibacillus sp. VTT E-133280]OZQ82309.1 DNA-binding response regulator [Paenibacillus sp. VTT E-133291]
MNRILLVEDDENLAFGIEYTLTSEGYTVVVAGSIKEARKALKTVAVDLILLDVNLPDGSGYDLCREIRVSSQNPIIFLTALDEEANVVAGLDLGADDYMTKPIRTKELISRMKAVLRRKPKLKDEVDRWISDDIEVRVLEGTVHKHNQELLLTGLEYRLLLMLMTHPKQICSRSSILNSLWDMSGDFIDDNTLSVHIRRLREKIEDNPAAPKYIITVRGVGYKWNATVIGR